MAIENVDLGQLPYEEREKWPPRAVAEALAARGHLYLIDEMYLEEVRELLLARLGRVVDGLRVVPDGVLGLYETIDQALNEIGRLRDKAFWMAMALTRVVGEGPKEEWEAFLASRDAHAYPAEGTYPITVAPHPFQEQLWREWREARATAERQPIDQ